MKGKILKGISLLFGELGFWFLDKEEVFEGDRISLGFGAEFFRGYFCIMIDFFSF